MSQYPSSVIVVHITTEDEVLHRDTAACHITRDGKQVGWAELDKSEKIRVIHSVSAMGKKLIDMFEEYGN